MPKRTYKVSAAIIVVLIALISLFFAYGSGRISSRRAVEKFVDTYYSVDNYMKMTDDPTVFEEEYKDTYSVALQSLISRNAFEEDMRGRGQIGLFLGCVKNKFNVEVTGIKADKATEKDDGSVIYDYNASLVLKFLNKSVVQNIDGQVTVNKKNGRWMIEKINKAALPVNYLT